MKRLAALAALPVLAGCTSRTSVTVSNTPAVAGSGVPKTETRTVQAFHHIRLEGVAAVKVTVGPATSVRVTADDNLLPIVRTELQGDTLVIGEKQSISTRKGIVVTVTTPDLAGISQAGAGAFDVAGLKGSDFRLDCSGVGAVSIAGSADAMDVATSGAAGIALSGLDTKRLVVRLDGVGAVTASGRAEQIEGSLAGAGALDAHDLVTKDARVTVSGVGGARVNATGSLDAKISGIGGVTYRGSPASLKTESTGLGAVVQE